MVSKCNVFEPRACEQFQAQEKPYPMNETRHKLEPFREDVASHLYRMNNVMGTEAAASPSLALTFGCMSRRHCVEDSSAIIAIYLTKF